MNTIKDVYGDVKELKKETRNDKLTQGTAHTGLTGHITQP